MLVLLLTSSSTYLSRPSRLPRSRLTRSSRTALVMGPVEPDETWTTLPSGLKYLDVTIGDGEMPESGAVVGVDYTGWTVAEGNQFDSSKGPGRGVFNFPLGQGRVIPGWDEGIATMRVGGERKLYIPPDLGYGAEGAGADIPPGATLYFECELKAIETGFSAFVKMVPGGIPNIVVTTLLLLSFVPYAFPPESRPDFYT